MFRSASSNIAHTESVLSRSLAYVWTRNAWSIGQLLYTTSTRHEVMLTGGSVASQSNRYVIVAITVSSLRCCPSRRPRRMDDGRLRGGRRRASRSSSTHPTCGRPVGSSAAIALRDHRLVHRGRGLAPTPAVQRESELQRRRGDGRGPGRPCTERAGCRTLLGPVRSRSQTSNGCYRDVDATHDGGDDRPPLQRLRGTDRVLQHADPADLHAGGAESSMRATG